ncbi:MAG: GSCFA domain-containing protein, partial [Cyclobacteriaceae bacterium]
MFHLPFPIPASPIKISLADSVVSMGSCFADSIGSKLSDHKFNILSNPFGTIYNPISLCDLFNDEINDSEIIENKGVYYHWQAHGEISALTKDDLLENLNSKRQNLKAALLKADWLIITLGSAFAYRLKSSQKIVANCHKVPQSEFTKELLSIEAMAESLSNAFQQLKTQNPSLNIIFTVSPVRHTRDGLVENNRSKARLMEVSRELSQSNDWITYFPAYEIMVDELRDYRFYAKDLVHPNEEAIDYIWKRFGETYFDPDTASFVENWSQ